MRFPFKAALPGLVVVGWLLTPLTAGVPQGLSSGIFTLSPSPGGLVVGFPGGPAEIAAGGAWAAIGLNYFNAERGRSESVAGLLELRAGVLRWSHRYANSNCCGDPLVRVSPDGSRVLAAGDEVVLWDRFGKVLSRMPLPEGKISIAATISDDGRRGVVVASNGTLLALDMQTGARIWTMDGFEGPTGLSVSASGDVVAVGSVRGIFLRDRAGRRELLWPGLWRWAAVVLDQDGDRLAAAWKLPDGTVVAGALQIPGRFRGPLWTKPLWRGTVPSVTMDAQGRTILVGDFLGRGAALLTWGGRILWRSSQEEGVRADLSRDGAGFVVASRRRVEVYRLPDLTLQGEMVLPGIALKVRTARPWLLVLGTTEQGSVVPNRVWGFQMHRDRP